MKVIAFDKWLYQHMAYLDGSEASIYLSLDHKTILKKFSDDLCKKQLENKKSKLLLLEQIEPLKYIYPNITSFIYEDGDFIGYTMDYFKGLLLNELFLDFEEKLILLKDLKQKILKLKEEKIYYFDLHFDNILCSKEKKTLDLKLIDIDNIKIGSYNYDTRSFFVQNYLELGGKNDDNALIHIFNLMSYCLLTSQNCFNMEILKANYKDTITKYFYDKLAQNICFDLFAFHIDSLSDHEFLIDSIDYDYAGNKILFK